MWKNDPAIGAIPHAGHGSVDIGRRTQCGEAVVYDGKNVAELIDFLGDAGLVDFEKQLYRRNDDGTLGPANLDVGAIVVKPPAGDWFVINADALQQEFAIVVTVPNQLHQGAPEHDKRTMPPGTIAHTVDLGGATSNPAGAATFKDAPAKKAAAKKAAPAKKAPVKKAAAKAK